MAKNNKKQTAKIPLTNNVWDFENIDENIDLSLFETISVQNFNGDYKKYSEKLKEDLKLFQKHYAIALEQVDSIRRQYRDLKLMYDTMANSTFWKITKPLRFLLDVIKYPFKLHLLEKARKFFKYWKKYGFAYALAKTRQYRLGKQQVKNVSIIIPDDVRIVQSQTKFPKDVKISILVPLYNTSHDFLVQMIESVRAQTYSNWELCLADGSTPEFIDVRQTCLRYTKQDERIKYKKLIKNGGISENTNACIDMATGDYIALFDHDDLLHPSVLHDVMTVICEKNADYIYTDEATFESPDVTKILSVHYKPDFAIDNLRANNYICHFSVFSREVLEKSGKFRSEFDGSQDHDMILRLTSNAQNIVHIPKVLYFWRSHPLSVAMDINSKTYAIAAGKNAVKSEIESIGYNAKVESTKVFPAMYRITYEIKEDSLVSLIIYNPTEYKVLEKSIQQLTNNTDYTNIDITIASNKPLSTKLSEYIFELKEKNTVKNIHLNEKECTPALLNSASKLVNGKYILFLDGDTIPVSKKWICELLMYAQREDVAITAGTLYYPSNSIRHAGYIIGNGTAHSISRMFYGINNSSVGYMGRLWYAQNLSAVSAEMMLVSKAKFEELGGFDEDYSLSYFDADLCLKAREKGQLIVWTPYANAYTYTSGIARTKKNLKATVNDVKRFKENWATVLDMGDPYYNPNFSPERADFTL